MDNPKNNNENEINCPDIHGSAIYDPTNEGIQKYSPACKKHMKPFKFKFDKSFSHELAGCSLRAWRYSASDMGQ